MSGGDGPPGALGKLAAAAPLLCRLWAMQSPEKGLLARLPR